MNNYLIYYISFATYLIVHKLANFDKRKDIGKQKLKCHESAQCNERRGKKNVVFSTTFCNKVSRTMATQISSTTRPLCNETASFNTTSNTSQQLE